MGKRRKRDIKVWYANKQESGHTKHLESLFKKAPEGTKIIEESAAKAVAKYFASKHLGENLFVSPKGKIYRGAKKF